jgi:hypothetical protein
MAPFVRDSCAAEQQGRSTKVLVTIRRSYIICWPSIVQYSSKAKFVNRLNRFHVSVCKCSTSQGWRDQVVKRYAQRLTAVDHLWHNYMITMVEKAGSHKEATIRITMANQRENKCTVLCSEGNTKRTEPCSVGFNSPTRFSILEISPFHNTSASIQMLFGLFTRAKAVWCGLYDSFMQRLLI